MDAAGAGVSGRLKKRVETRNIATLLDDISADTFLAIFNNERKRFEDEYSPKGDIGETKVCCYLDWDEDCSSVDFRFYAEFTESEKAMKERLEKEAAHKAKCETFAKEGRYNEYLKLKKEFEP